MNTLSPEFIVNLWHGQPWTRLLGREYRDAWDRSHTLCMCATSSEMAHINHIERIQNCRARGIEPRAVPTVEEIVRLGSRPNLSVAVTLRFRNGTIKAVRRVCEALRLPAREVQEAAIHLWKRHNKIKIVKTIILELPELWDFTCDIIMWKSFVLRFQEGRKTESFVNNWLHMPETSQSANLRAAALCLWRHHYRLIDSGDVKEICAAYNALWTHSAAPLMCVVLVFSNLSLTKTRITEVVSYHSNGLLSPRSWIEKKALRRIVCY